jgi:hypothetical protein
MFFLKRESGSISGVFSEIPDRPQLIGSLLNLSELYDRTHRRREAWIEAQRALKIATEISSETLLQKANEQLLKIEIVRTRREGPVFRFHDLLFASATMQSLVNRLKLVAITNEIVLIHGETGTGKELLAQGLTKRAGAAMVLSFHSTAPVCRASWWRAASSATAKVRSPALTPTTAASSEPHRAEHCCWTRSAI